MTAMPEPRLRAYERAADDTRRHLSSSLDELAANLTPGRMVDEALSYARSGGGDFLAGLGKAASANPIPTLLIGVGAAMFLSGKGRIGEANTGNGRQSFWNVARNRQPVEGGKTGSARSTGSGIGSGLAAAGSHLAHGVGDVASGVRDSVAAAGSAVAGAASNVADQASAAVGSVGEAAGHAASFVGETAGAVADTVSGAAGHAASFVGETAGAVAGTVSGFAASARDAMLDEGKTLRDQSTRLIHELRDRGSDVIREQPLVVAAIGLAIGAAVAALLPRTATEDSLMGEASDAVKEAVGEVAGEQYDQAKSAAGKVVEEAKTTAVREGLSAGAAAGAIRTLSEKVVSVVGAAADSAKPAGQV
jgi:hypothetical protein